MSMADATAFRSPNAAQPLRWTSSERVTRKLAEEHGEDYWRTIIRAGGRAWRDIAATPDEDFYERRLHQLRVPMLVVHGADDPRRPADRSAGARAALPRRRR